jgi:hypothetical protein
VAAEALSLLDGRLVLMVMTTPYVELRVGDFRDISSDGYRGGRGSMRPALSDDEWCERRWRRLDDGRGQGRSNTSSTDV